MEWIWNTYIWLSILISVMSVLLALRRNANNSVSKLPPGPRGWPIIGNILDLGTLPHRSLAAMKKQYGPVVWLNLGSLNAMVILSAGVAEELVKNHDLSFIDRNIVETIRSHDYYKSAIGFLPYGSYWRTMRRICAAQLFTQKKIKETESIRQKCVDDMLLWIEKECEVTTGIEVIQFVFPTMFNIFGNLMLSRDLVNPHSQRASEFYTAMSGFAECIGLPNISDFFPWLKWLDLQGLKSRMDFYMSKTIEITSKFVKERFQLGQHKEGISSTRTKDFLDVLLDFEGTEKDELKKFTENQITIFIMDMFIGGTETVSTTVEWAMSELLQNPEAMTKVKIELSKVVGGKKKLEESDIDNLHYLQAIVKETLRLHPPAAINYRKTIRDTNFMGYSIPKSTLVLINTWAIGRDEDLWDDASSFKPQRFLRSNIQYKGQNFEFIPFGAGRRMCPGLPLADRMVPLILGSLLHHFEWEICGNIGVETTLLDMTEATGLTAKKLKQLKVVPKRTV